MSPIKGQSKGRKTSSKVHATRRTTAAPVSEATDTAPQTASAISFPPYPPSAPVQDFQLNKETILDGIYERKKADGLIPSFNSATSSTPATVAPIQLAEPTQETPSHQPDPMATTINAALSSLIEPQGSTPCTVDTFDITSSPEDEKDENGTDAKDSAEEDMGRNVIQNPAIDGSTPPTQLEEVDTFDRTSFPEEKN